MMIRDLDRKLEEDYMLPAPGLSSGAGEKETATGRGLSFSPKPKFLFSA
jgi:hypothetical protein